MSFIKFKYLLVSAICFVWFSCSESQLGEEDNEWKGDFSTFDDSFEQKQDLGSSDESPILYLKGEDKPFSGSVEKNSSTRLTIDKYADGLLNGISIRKSSDGSWVEANYKAGKLHGKMTFYDKIGNIRSVMNYENGSLIPTRADLVE